jgi:hypothetical protein
VTYKKLYEETAIKVLISKVRGLELDDTIKFPSGLIALHADGVVREHGGASVYGHNVSNVPRQGKAPPGQIQHQGPP